MRQGNVIFAGAPSSGKSTTFDAFQTGLEKYPEIARIILEGGLFGKSIKEVIDSGNYPTFQERTVLLHRQYERLSHDDGGALHDAGTVSAWAYCQDLQENVRKRLSNVIERHLMENGPRKVFVFEPLKYQQDGQRHESPKIQQVIHKRIVDLCEGLQLDWELVPAMGLELRCKFIKNGLKK